jgi:hypothetical protein
MSIDLAGALKDKKKAKEYFDLFYNDLGEFAAYFFDSYLTVKAPKFHGEIYELLKNENRVALAAPRGHAKSTIISVIYPTWLALFHRRSDICVISASETLAVELVRKIKHELESNRKIIAFFGDVKSDKWTESHLVLNNKYRVNIRAKGAGGQIRGFRPDVLICDDIETDLTVESQEQRDKLKNWIFKACLNTLLPHGQFIIIGTIIHPLSVLNDLLEIDNGWKKKKYRAYIDAVQEKGYELWPNMWSHERLQARKAEIGSWAFAAEYLNDPVFDETAADYKVASLVGIDKNDNRYLISYIRTHNPTGDFIDQVLNLYLANKGVITGVGLPKGAGDTEFFNSFLRRMQERKIFECPLVELKNTFLTADGNKKRNKGARIIAALQGLFERGKYYLHETQHEARDEILSVTPNHLPRYDDLCLVKGTKIATLFGDKNIEDIRSGEIVLTHYGTHRVIKAGKTGQRRIIKRFGVEATPNHKIFSSKHGNTKSYCV